MPGPLSGVRVLDLSAVVAGPLAGALLADQGAHVIKVERLGAGDIQRHVGSSRNGFSGFFHMLNRGKQSIALNLSHPKAIQIIHKLAAQSDVVIQNFRPGVVDRLGIGYDALREVNDQIIYLSISGFGADGPQAKRRAYDPIIQTYSGMAEVQGRKRNEGPEQVNQLIMDKLTAHHGCQAICAALYYRTQSGKGQHIALSMLDTAVSFLWPDAGADDILQGDNIQHRPPIGGSGQLMQYKDGWGAIMILSDQEFKGMCTAFELPQLAENDMFNTIEARMNHRTEYHDVMATTVSDAALKLTLSEAEQRLSDNGVPFARLRKLADLPDDPQAQHNELFQVINHPTAGLLRETRPAPRFSESPATPQGFAPEVGEHTEAVLSLIGLEAELEALVNEGVVGRQTPPAPT